ncbi:amyloid P component, serum [Sardina pilchardus]|uniref:amyloid P component, serum n=1 Tax=Sardina pilchardus TaxID=27697 RepID=UPI002E14939B
MKRPELVFLAITLCSIAAQAAEDLSGKVFSFPQYGRTPHVRLTPSNSSTQVSATFCLRVFTDFDHYEFALFSTATAKQSRSFTVIRRGAEKQYQIVVDGNEVNFYGLPFDLNKWNSICVTLDGKPGLSQIFVNGIHSLKKEHMPGVSIADNPIIILGRDQNNYGGELDRKKGFVGQMRNVNMWNYVFSPCEIESYMQELVYNTGNNIDWKKMDFSHHGVLLENYETC